MWEGMHRYIGSCRKVGFPVAGDTGSCEPSVTQVPVTKLESARRAAMLRGAEPSLQAPAYLYTALCFRTMVSHVTTRNHMAGKLVTAAKSTNQH